MKELMKMLAKKKGAAEDMSEKDKKAKLDVLKELMDLANETEGKNVASGMKSMMEKHSKKSDGPLIGVISEYKADTAHTELPADAQPDEEIDETEDEDPGDNEAPSAEKMEAMLDKPDKTMLSEDEDDSMFNRVMDKKKKKRFEDD